MDQSGIVTPQYRGYLNIDQSGIETPQYWGYLKTSSSNLGTCYQGWTWLSDLCYKVEPIPMSWEDARDHCITINGHLVQFDDIPQQTEVQKNLFSDMNDDKTGWTWTDGQSNQYNSFKDQTQDDGQCVMMDRRFWYETNCSNNHPVVCQAAPTECDNADEWLLTPSYHCIMTKIGNTTWHKAREYCKNNNADLVLWDSNTELQMLKNISISLNSDLWIGLYYNDSNKLFTWVNGTAASKVISSHHTFSPTSKQCIALQPEDNQQKASWVQRSCDEQMGFICQLVSGRRHTYITTDTATIADAITTIDEKPTVTVSSTLDENTTTALFTTSYKISTKDTATGLTTHTIKDNITTYSLQDRQYHLERDALQCNVDGMNNVTKAVARICTKYIKVLDYTVVLKVLLKILDSAFENDNDSSLHNCLQSKESITLIEPFVSFALKRPNISTKQELHLQNLDYILDFVNLSNVSDKKYYVQNTRIQEIEPMDNTEVKFIEMNRSNSSIDSDKAYIISPILSLTAFSGNKEISLSHIFQIQHYTLIPQINISEDANNTLCAYYDKNESIWSDYGCLKLKGNSHRTMCKCNHTTNFAILMQVRQLKLDNVHVLVLDIITYIGCSISLLTQLITLTVFTCVGSLNSERVFVHRNLCISIICAQLGFLSGIKAIEYKTVCAIVAAILHYFYTAVFVWMLVEGLLLYSKVVQVFGTEKSRVTYYCIFGWGVPIVIVAVSASADWNGYGTSTSCWLSTKTGAIWAFVGPAIAIILVNIVILWMVIKIVISSAKHDQKTEYSQIRAGVKGALILVPLLGLTWMFGLMAVNEDFVIFQYLFAICNSLQGFFIFLFHCVFNSEVRQALKRLQERQRLMRDFTSFSSASSRNSSSKDKDLKQQIIRRERKNSSGTTSTSLGSRNSIASRSSKLTDDIVVEDINGEELELSYI
ncbi:ADGRD1 [Mytilus coruscus]|uniref:ADGRD1 n=1 Tax=Mytilus coruscus TaxID=42192 RepID=A0A6J8BTH6_MYTCO|nr:ADGRD1 [Mytilus coruscus]